MHVGSNYPDQGSNPGPLHWERRDLPTGPPGKSLYTFLRGAATLYLRIFFLMHENLGWLSERIAWLEFSHNQPEHEQIQEATPYLYEEELLDEVQNHRPAVNSRVCFPVYLKNNRRGPFLLTWNSQSFNSPSRVLQTVPKAPWPQSRKPGQRHLAKGLDQRSGGESWCLTRRVMVSQALNLPVSWFPPRHSYLTE